VVSKVIRKGSGSINSNLLTIPIVQFHCFYRLTRREKCKFEDITRMGFIRISIMIKLLQLELVLKKDNTNTI